MLTIRAAQMAELDRMAREEFHRRLAADLRQTFPEYTAGQTDQQLLERVVQADRKATAYGLETEKGLSQFIALTFTAGPNFDEIPAVQQYLRFPGIDPHHKIDVLVDCLAEMEQEQKDEEG
jgi:hypothetical protein